MRQKLSRAFAILLIVAGSLVIVFGLCVWAFEKMSAPTDAAEQQLIYATNLQEIVSACDQIRADPKLVGKSGSPKAIDGPGWTDAPLPAGTLPPALQQLNFEVILIEPERVQITFGGGFYHYGYEATTGERQAGQWQLRPGLWYWNEGRFPANPAEPNWYPRKSAIWMTVGGLMLALGIWRMRATVRGVVCHTPEAPSRGEQNDGG
jgi:hypothetical protein